MTATECPYCNSENTILKSSRDFVEDDVAYVVETMHCLECEKNWEVFYTPIKIRAITGGGKSYDIFPFAQGA